MNIKRIAVTVLVLALAITTGAGTLVAFATEPVATKEGSFNKASVSFVGIDAIAAEVLGVSVESLEGLNHADQLYAKLSEAGKVDEFKTALIAAKRAMIDAKAGSNQISADKLAQIMASYTQTINAWNGTTELVMGYRAK